MLLIYKDFLSKIERRLVKNTFINQLYKLKRPGIAAQSNLRGFGVSGQTLTINEILFPPGRV